MARPKTYDERLRRTLVDTAAELIAAHGAEALALRPLAERAGTSTNAVYSLFGSLTWNITDQWSLSGDLRYSDDGKNAMQERHTLFGVTPPSWAAPLSAPKRRAFPPAIIAPSRVMWRGNVYSSTGAPGPFFLIDSIAFCAPALLL